MFQNYNILFRFNHSSNKEKYVCKPSSLYFKLKLLKSSKLNIFSDDIKLDNVFYLLTSSFLVSLILFLQSC